VKKSWRQTWCNSTGNWFEITIYDLSGGTVVQIHDFRICRRLTCR
jgi:hypothetical protein